MPSARSKSNRFRFRLRQPTWISTTPDHTTRRPHANRAAPGPARHSYPEVRNRTGQHWNFLSRLAGCPRPGKVGNLRCGSRSPQVSTGRFGRAHRGARSHRRNEREIAGKAREAMWMDGMTGRIGRGRNGGGELDSAAALAKGRGTPALNRSRTKRSILAWTDWNASGKGAASIGRREARIGHQGRWRRHAAKPVGSARRWTSGGGDERGERSPRDSTVRYTTKRLTTISLYIY